VNRAIDAATTQQRSIGRVHDRVDVERGDIGRERDNFDRMFHREQNCAACCLFASPRRPARPLLSGFVSRGGVK
jgi:hypothetical protein